MGRTSMPKPAIVLGFFALIFLVAFSAPSWSGDRSGLFERGVPSVLEKFKNEIDKKAEGKNKKHEDNNGQEKKKGKKDEAKKDKSKPLNCKKAKCEPGLIKLDKPNIYGACCQAGAEAPQKKPETEKCKFPGEVGTPPNCSCPPGTEFMGYKGCVPKLTKLCRQMEGVNANINSFKAEVNCKGNASCNPIGGDGDKQLCCCDVQIVD